MDKLQEERLTLLIEECAEVIKCATKIKRFGFDSNKDDSGRTNKELLEREIADVLVIIDFMVRREDVNGDNIDKFCEEKEDKLNKYLVHNQI